MANVALQYLTPATLTKVNAVLANDPAKTGTSMPAVATWADSYRYTTAGEFSAPFHYIDSNDSPPSCKSRQIGWVAFSDKSSPGQHATSTLTVIAGLQDVLSARCKPAFAYECVTFSDVVYLSANYVCGDALWASQKLTMPLDNSSYPSWPGPGLPASSSYEVSYSLPGRHHPAFA